MFFVYPFGVNGDLTTVPTTAAPDILSYEYGFGADFELPFPSNPSALPIPRDQFNQLMYDITSSIQQYQTVGTPPWITASENLGVAYPYPIFARVYYGGLIYENQVANNTATPGTDSSWMVISGAYSGVQTGMVMEYAGVSAPAGYLMCDGTNTYSRTTYANLFNATTFIQNGTTDGVTAVITGLTNTALMYVGEYLEGAGIPANSTIVSINSSTSITISHTTTISSTSALTFFPYGAGNSSSTFAVPNRIDIVAAGAGGTLLASSGQSGTGLKGGAVNYKMQTSDVASHGHAPPVGATGYVLNQSSGANTVSGAPGGIGSAADTGLNQAAGTNTAMPIVQPTILMNFIIKT